MMNKKVEKVVPSRKEVFTDGRWYRAGDTYTTYEAEKKKTKDKSEESK